MKRRERERVARELAEREQLRQHDPGDLYHGGVPGLAPGDLLLPPTLSGARSNAEFGAAGACRRDRVYLHADQRHARLFALLCPAGPGSLYRAEPLGSLEVDPDFAGVGSYCAPSARVLEVVEPEVVEWEGINAALALAVLSR